MIYWRRHPLVLQQSGQILRVGRHCRWAVGDLAVVVAANRGFKPSRLPITEVMGGVVVPPGTRRGLPTWSYWPLGSPAGPCWASSSVFYFDERTPPGLPRLIEFRA
ncbi:GM20521 [Drosophila sechellia]|uniref:GM20521 n=1 Tax=Drosophila sechellia TaxID=7238 RepID=B4IMM9_DROSE|nr:GM20521 [Drosophila sechellia]